MNQSVDRIETALANKEEILLIGDYDADGISSVSIVQKVLSELGEIPLMSYPKDMMKATGLLKKFLREDLKIRVLHCDALDCGTNSTEEANFLREKGIDLIVVDHHQAKGTVSNHAIILNPHLGKTNICHGTTLHCRTSF